MGMNNQYDSLRPCDKDYIVTYRNSGKMQIDDGVLKCSSNSQQTDSTILWKLQDSKLNTNLNIGSRIIRDTYNIELLDNKNRNLGISFNNGKDT